MHLCRSVIPQQDKKIDISWISKKLKKLMAEKSRNLVNRKLRDAHHKNSVGFLGKVKHRSRNGIKFRKPQTRY